RCRPRCGCTMLRSEGLERAGSNTKGPSVSPCFQPTVQAQRQAHDMTRSLLTFRCAMVLAVGVMLGLGLSLGGQVSAERAAPQPQPPLPWRDARLFAEVLERVRQEYVDDVSDQALIEAAIRGMVSDLDPHSAYLGPAEFDEIRISTSGEYSGVGIEVALENGAVKVIAPIEGSPAERAGVLPGDTIVAVDDVPVEGVADLDEVIDRMRGKPGTRVRIAIR